MKKLYFILGLVFIFNSCHHTKCRFAPPKFSSNQITVNASLKVQNIQPLSYEPYIDYHWYVLSSPTKQFVTKKEASRSSMLSYIFNEVGTYQLQLNASKSGCEADSVIITVHSTGTASIPFPCSATLINTLIINGQHYDGSQIEFLDDIGVKIGDRFSDNITISFSTAFFKNPLFGDYIITNKKGHTNTSKECNVAIEGNFYEPTNAPYAIVHVLPGENKNYQMTICNFNYDAGWGMGEVIAKIEFD